MGLLGLSRTLATELGRIAAAVCFLASSDARHITATELVIERWRLGERGVHVPGRVLARIVQ